jgi:TRAP-type C4-dicarboxylate transport system permease small subunit
MDRFERFNNVLSKWFNWVAGVGMVAMLALICVDIIGAKLFHWPVPGAIEVIGFLGVVVTAFAIAQTQILRGHIQVEFFIMRLPRQVQRIIGCIISFLSLVLFTLLIWRSCDFGYTLQITGEVSLTEEIPFYPFVYGIALACIPVCLVLLADFLMSLSKAVRK